jgi:hypothetical protein
MLVALKKGSRILSGLSLGLSKSYLVLSLFKVSWIYLKLQGRILLSSDGRVSASKIEIFQYFGDFFKSLSQQEKNNFGNTLVGSLTRNLIKNYHFLTSTFEKNSKY